MGLTVVLARRNVTTPDMPVTNPVETRTAASQLCAGSSYSGHGTAREMTHMPTAIIRTISGGGIFDSRESMTSLYCQAE